MEMRKSDVLDRWTILLMKAQHSDEVKGELKQYTKEVRGMLGVDFDLVHSIVMLAMANARTWENEAAIRGGESMPEDEVGRKALAIRRHNKVRVQSRQSIDKHFGESSDVKVDHASQ